MLTEAQKELNRERSRIAVLNAKKVLKKLLEDHRLVKHKEKLFDVSKRYFAAELTVGVDHSRSKRGDFI